MNLREQLEGSLARMQDRSPGGFAIGLHLAFTTSKYIVQTYPVAWMEEYSRRGLIIADPTVRWGVENLGFVRWSTLRDNDEGGVIDAAAEYGLKYGVSIAVEQGGSRSLGSFASPTAEFSEADIQDLTETLEGLHDLTLNIDSGSPDDALMQRIVSSIKSVDPISG